MEQRNLKFMLRCQHNFHIILYCRGKLISQLIKVAAARGIHQHSKLDSSLYHLVWYICSQDKIQVTSLKKKKNERVRDLNYIQKRPKRGRGSIKTFTSASSSAGICSWPQNSTPHNQRRERLFQDLLYYIVILSNID